MQNLSLNGLFLIIFQNKDLQPKKKYIVLVIKNIQGGNIMGRSSKLYNKDLVTFPDTSIEINPSGDGDQPRTKASIESVP